MNSKLTLNIDEKVITRAKRYARRNKISVSRMVEKYLNAVSSEKTETSISISQHIEWLTSSDNKVIVSKKEIINQLIGKRR